MIAIILFVLFLLFGTMGPVSVANAPVASPDSSTVAVVQEAPAALAIEAEAILRASTGTEAAAVYVASETSLFRFSETSEWERVGNAPPVGNILVAADDPDLLLVGDDGECARGSGGAPLQRSTDGGATWEQVAGEAGIRPLAIWTAEALAVGADCSGLVVSTDAGETWTPVNDDLLGADVTAFATLPEVPGEVLAGLTGEGGTTRLYRLDLTASAAAATPEPLLEYWGIAGIAASAETVHVAGITGVTSIYDGGDTWSTNRTGLEDVTLEQDPLVDGVPDGMDLDGYGLNAILLSGDAPLLVGGEAAVYQYFPSDVRQSDTAEWELAVRLGSPILSFTQLPESALVLVQTETEVWTVTPEPWV